MKVALVLCVLSAVLISNTNAQFGLGLGFPFFRPFFRPFFNPFFRPFGLGFGFGGGLLGKREVIEQQNMTVCSLETGRNVLSCHGDKHNFDCNVESKFENWGSLNLTDLIIYPVVELNQTAVNDFPFMQLGQMADQIPQIDRYILLSRKSEVMLNEYTTILPEGNRNVTASIVDDEEPLKTDSIRLTKECYTQFQTVVSEVDPTVLRFNLIISQ